MFSILQGTCLKNTAVLAAFWFAVSVFAQDQPNIVFIMVDDLGKEWISAYGAEGISTPNIDFMAENGMMFDNAYSMPQCTPTRVALLAGQYPFNNGWVRHWDVPRWSLPQSEGGKGGYAHFDWKYYTTFARVMKSAGYVTAAAGKWQITDFRVHPDGMELHGFEEYAMWTGYETGNPPSANRYWDPYIYSAGESRTYTDQFGPDIYTDFLIDFMGRNVDKPQMLYFPMCLTHGPFTTTPHNLTASTNRQKHIAMVEYTDYLVGRLIDAADSLGIDSNTIIIFTTDNGTAGSMTNTLDGHSVSGGKTKLGENGICAPFIVYCPGLVPAGVVSDVLTDFTDMLPTFAELGGVDLDTLYSYYELDGHSIAKAILGQPLEYEREWIMAMGGGAGILGDSGIQGTVDYAPRSVRDKQYKVRVDNSGAITDIYDLLADPWEENNLINSSNPDVLAALEKFNGIIATFPEKDARPVYDSALFVPPRDTVPDPGTLNLIPDTATHVIPRESGESPGPGRHILHITNTYIRFQVSAPAYVSLDLYHVSGRKIAALAHGWRHAGTHEADMPGGKLQNGLYVIELKIDNAVERKRIILIE